MIVPYGAYVPRAPEAVEKALELLQQVQGTYKESNQQFVHVNRVQTKQVAPEKVKKMTQSHPAPKFIHSVKGSKLETGLCKL